MRYAWDNSNIVESYPGVCSPLTFSFARYVYREVYRQTAMLFGVNPRLVDKMYRKLETFLGYFDGRFYYNLEAWCTLIGHLPGLSANPALLQEMMGVRKEDRISVRPSRTSLLTALRLAAIFIYHHFTLPGLTARWVSRFDSDFRKTVADLDKVADAYGAFRLFCAVEYRYLRDWQIPILNDFSVMVYSGLLRKFNRKYLGHDLEPAQISHIGGGNARMVVSLRQIALAVRADRHLLEELPSLSHARLWERMNEHPQVSPLLRAFLGDFGLRNGHDLKLETPNLEENPALFVELIKQYVRADTPHTARSRQAQPRRERDGAQLTFVKRLVLDYLVKQAKSAILRREEMRLKRSQIFGAMRKIFLKIGSHLAERGVIAERDDVFYLEMDEILQILQGMSTLQDVRPLIAQRREELALAAAQTVRPHFTTEGIPGLDRSWRVGADQDAECSQLSVSGTPNYPGLVTGEVVVMERPDFSRDVKGKILVCQHTDPSWVPFLGLIRGLVVERGGILSHAAIVSRELRVPSVIGVANATRVLRSGQRVTLDSKVGKVVVV